MERTYGYNDWNYGSFGNDKWGGWHVWGENYYGDIMGWKGTTYSSYNNSDFVTSGGARAKNIKNIAGFWAMLKAFFTGNKDAVESGQKASTIYEVVTKNTNTSSIKVQNIEPVAPPSQSVKTIVNHIQPITNIDTVHFIVTAWKDGNTQGGGNAYGIKKAKGLGKTLMREWNLDSVTVQPINNPK